MADTHPSDAAIPALAKAGVWNGDKRSKEILKAVWTPVLWDNGDNEYDFVRAFKTERLRRVMVDLGLEKNLLKRDLPAPKVSAPRKRRAPSKPTRNSPRKGAEPASRYRVAAPPRPRRGYSAGDESTRRPWKAFRRESRAGRAQNAPPDPKSTTVSARSDSHKNLDRMRSARFLG